MNIKFEKTPYLAAIKENPKFNDNQEILDFVKRELKFKYADVSHQKFNEKYSSEGWFGRKVIALPAAVCSVLVKTIYHLAKAIFIGFSEDEQYFQAQWFCIGRDFQEGFGRLVSLFNDRYGQYHIQASGFHKSCYETFLSSRGASKPPSPSFSIPSSYLYNPPRTQPFSQPNFPNSFNDLYKQNEFHPRLNPSYFVSDTATFTNRENQPSDKQSVINKVMRDPNSFQNLSYDLKNDEDVVAAALSGCTSAEQAKKVISNANYNAKNSKKVALALVKIDPTQFGQLNYDAKNDEDVVAAALDGCTSAEQAKKVISDANYNAKNSKKVALALVKIAPTQFGQLNYDAKNDEDVVAAALSGCTSAEQAKKVISDANYNAKNSKKVALALVKIAPTQFGQLNYDAKNDEDVVAAALSGCTSAEQAKKVISDANYNAKNSKKVALALVKIDPTLLGHLNYDAKNDLNVVLLAIKLSTEHTIHKIWNSVGIDAAFNKEVRAKVKEKYPYFFQDSTFEGFPSSNTQSTTNQTPHATAPTKWSEPGDLKNNTSDEANIVRGILKQNYLLGINLTKTDVSKEIAKGILCQLLELDKNVLDKDLKKAYHKAVLRIHPDKLKLQSGEEAFKVLTAAYKQAEL